MRYAGQSIYELDGFTHVRRNRFRELILFLLTLAPWVVWAFIIVGYAPSFETTSELHEAPEQVFQDPFIRGMMVAVLLTLGLMAFYLVHLYRTSRLPAGKRALWLALIVFANILAMPFYWYFYVWLRQDDEAA